MKKTLFVLLITILAIPLYSQVLPIVGILPFEVYVPEDPGPEFADGDPSAAARSAALSAQVVAELTALLPTVTAQVTAELESWRMMTIVPPDRAAAADYVVRGYVNRIDDQIVLTAVTSDRRSGRVLNNSRVVGASIATISIEAFAEQIASYIPIPNFLLGTWQALLNLPDGPAIAILEFRADRTVRVHRFDTWEHRGTDSLRYQAIGTGTYTYAGYRRRAVNMDGRQVVADATVGIILELEDALDSYTTIDVPGLRLLFDDERNNFDIVFGGIPFGDNFSGPDVFPASRVFYLDFRKIQYTGPVYAMSEAQEAVQNPGSAMPVQAAPNWFRDIGVSALDRPYLMAESLVLANADGSIRSIYMTGTDLWNFNPQDEVTPFLARSVEGATYLSDTTGLFKAINRVGNDLWYENLGSQVTFHPVVGWDGRIFIPVGSRMYTRTASGQPLWSRDFESPMVLSPMLDNLGSVVTVLENRDFLRVSQFSAIDRIRLDEIPVHIAPVMSGSNQSYVLFYSGGRTEKINFTESGPRGNRLSRASFPSMESTPAAAAGRGDKIAAVLWDGRVLLIDYNGNILWTDNSHETAAERGRGNIDQSNTLVQFDSRGIYIITTRGATAFAEDGRRRFLHRFEEAVNIPAFSEEGLLFVNGTDSSIYAYKLDNKPLIVQRSRYYGPMPEGNYGLGDPPPSPWSMDPHRWEANEQARMYEILEAMINSGQIGENEPIITAYLHEIIGFFLTEGNYSQVRPRVLPMQHINFIRLLGRIGSRDTLPFLLTIFNRYHEPSVRSACAEAIGMIGVDPEGAAFISYSFFLTPNNPNRDPQLLLSAARSITDLSRFSGPPLAGEGILLLRFFSNLTWIPLRVREQINDYLAYLYREGLDRFI